MNQTQFIQRSSISKYLITAVVQQMGGWSSFKENAPDVTEHGAQAGWSGFIYYDDTCAFTKKFGDHIKVLVSEYVNEIGHESVVDMLSLWKCLDGYTKDEIAEAYYSNTGDAETAMQNALAWFALEEVCRAYEMEREWA